MDDGSDAFLDESDSSLYPVCLFSCCCGGDLDPFFQKFICHSNHSSFIVCNKVGYADLTRFCDRQDLVNGLFHLGGFPILNVLGYAEP